MNWEAAKDKCVNEEDAHLASIHSESELTAMTVGLDTVLNYWIALNDIEVDQTFVNIDGTKNDFEKWK